MGIGQQTNDTASFRLQQRAIPVPTDSRGLVQPSLHFDFPASWYFFGSVAELSRGPVAKSLLGKQLVGFLTPSGQPGVLESRCVHMGSNLGVGCVVGESLQCSLHHWQFDTQGRCVHIPATDSIPAFARQMSFPAVVRHGNVYFFLGRQARFPLPFFANVEPAELRAARPFVEQLECPWYMIGANAVDVQHFAIAHDRRMLRRPDVDHPEPWVHRTVCRFEVAGNSIADRITKRFGGRTVRLEVVDWSSTMIFAHSSLDKTETFGMLSIVPVDAEHTFVHVTVMARASDGRLSRRFVDPLRAVVRQILIRAFLRSDVHRLTGTRYSPTTYLEIDEQFSQYFAWLRGLSDHSAGK